MAWSDAARAAAAEARRMHKALHGHVKLGTSVKLSGSKPVSKRQAARNKKYMEQRNRRIANGTY